MLSNSSEFRSIRTPPDAHRSIKRKQKTNTNTIASVRKQTSNETKSESGEFTFFFNLSTIKFHY